MNLSLDSAIICTAILFVLGPIMINLAYHTFIAIVPKFKCNNAIAPCMHFIYALLVTLFLTCFINPGPIIYMAISVIIAPFMLFQGYDALIAIVPKFENNRAIPPCIGFIYVLSLIVFLISFIV